VGKSFPPSETTSLPYPKTDCMATCCGAHTGFDEEEISNICDARLCVRPWQGSAFSFAKAEDG